MNRLLLTLVSLAFVFHVCHGQAGLPTSIFSFTGSNAFNQFTIGQQEYNTTLIKSQVPGYAGYASILSYSEQNFKLFAHNFTDVILMKYNQDGHGISIGNAFTDSSSWFDQYMGWDDADQIAYAFGVSNTNLSIISWSFETSKKSMFVFPFGSITGGFNPSGCYDPYSGNYYLLRFNNNGQFAGNVEFIIYNVKAQQYLSYGVQNFITLEALSNQPIPELVMVNGQLYAISAYGPSNNQLTMYSIISNGQSWIATLVFSQPNSVPMIGINSFITCQSDTAIILVTCNSAQSIIFTLLDVTTFQAQSFFYYGSVFTMFQTNAIVAV